MMDKQEYRKKLDELGSRKDLIPGIHNYCDRWCERCPFTRKCGNYVLTEGLESNQEDVDLNNEKFWKDLSMIFEATFDMIREHAEELGIDLDNIDEEDCKLEVKNVEVEEYAREYGLNMINWLKGNSEKLNETVQKLLLVHENIALKFKDALEVVQWYSLFISAKVHRSMLDFGDVTDEYEDYDQKGSAKIAIIAIDRSIAALGLILEKIPDFEDDLLRFLAQLAKIKRDILKVYPMAMEFRRPGFDD